MAEDAKFETMKEIIKRSRQDEKFKKALIQDPKGTLKSEYGIEIPESVQLDVAEDTKEKTTINLPVLLELSDEDLAAVIGGETGGCGYDCDWCLVRAACSWWRSHH